MQLTFLQADRPLIKRYTKKTDGTLKKESYTSAYLFTSSAEEVETISDFHAALVAHARAGHCLHTGSFDTPLQNESRAGKFVKGEKRKWIVIDLDELKGFDTAEDVIAELPKAFHDVSYIEQHSAGSTLKPGLNMHLFFVLDREEDMADIKNWMMHANLETKSLVDKITLTAKDYGLSYPLDRIANDNGRIVYIAPPECVGFADPVPERIKLVNKGSDLLRYSFTSSVVSDVKKLERDLIAKLRKDKGLSTSKGDFYDDSKSGVEVLKRKLTEKGRVHPLRKDNDFIMRCNLDDGDSEAYYYYIKKPALLRNHKGEPALYMEAVDKEYYDKVALPEAKKLHEKDVQPFVFRNEYNDKYYVGLRLGDEIHKQPHVISSEAKIQDYFVQHNGFGVPDPIESWVMEFNPSLGKQWNPDKLVFNTWRKSEYMMNATYRSLPPVTINKIIDHVVGNDPEAYHHFMNWLAYVYQKRTKTGTAWVFHGVQGTGKGLLVDHVLKPIFGDEYVFKQTTRGLKDAFNVWMEKSIIVNIDEFDIEDTGADANGIMQNLKSWITDKYSAVRDMYAAQRTARSYSNFILTTNANSALPVDEGDRRISFGKRQEKRIQISHEEVAAVPGELQHFAGYLLGYKVDSQKAHTCLENDAKHIARHLGKTTIEEFVDAIKSGDLQYFVDGASEKGHDPALPGYYREILDGWIADAKADRPSAVRVPELLLAFKLICNEKSEMKQSKFVKMMQHKALNVGQPLDYKGKRFRGWKIDWVVDAETNVNIGGHIKPVKTQEQLEEEVRASLASPEVRQ